MLCRRNTIVWNCLWALILTSTQTLFAQISLVGARQEASSSIREEGDVQHATFAWPRDRQVLPNPFQSGIQQTAFVASDDSSPPDERDEASDNGSMPDDNSAAAAGSADETDLATRVRVLEEEIARLSAGNDVNGDDSLTSRLNHLEETLGEFEEEGSQYLETLARNSRRIFNGRLHLDTWQYPQASRGINAIENGSFAEDPQNRVLVRRARIGVRGTVAPGNMSYRLELEFSGQDGGRIRDAWLAWDDLPVLNTLRIGNQKRPYGLDHLNSSNFMTFLERPLIVDAINRGNRRVGLASYGGTPDLAWNWQAGAFNMVQIQDTNDIVGDKPQLEFAGRLANTAWYDDSSDGRGYAHFGLAGTVAFPDGRSLQNQSRFRSVPEAQTASDWLDTGQISGADAYQLLGLESVFNVGPLQVAGEWMHIWMQREAGFGSNLSFHGGYISLSYFLTGEHIPWNRKVGMLGRVKPFENFFCVNSCDGSRGAGLGAWQVALRLSRADFSDDDIRGGVGENLTLALNWYWNANTRLQFNYLFGQIEDRRTTLTNGMTPIVSGDYQIMGTRFMIDF